MTNLRFMRRSEDTEQIQVMRWAKIREGRYPELKWLHHIPNGGKRGEAEAGKFKQMGVKAGVADLHLPYAKGQYIGLWVELKFGQNKLQRTQTEFLADMEKAGHYVATCYGAENAVRIIETYLQLTDGMAMPWENNNIYKG